MVNNIKIKNKKFVWLLQLEMAVLGCFFEKKGHGLLGVKVFDSNTQKDH
jgi:hypothetical protein